MKVADGTVPLDDSWDILVAGGGPAGCAAATAAARDGAKTLLIESTSALGGMGTSGLVTCWAPYSDG
jgi:flavin-dependent dehydrogenase